MQECQKYEAQFSSAFMKIVVMILSLACFFIWLRSLVPLAHFPYTASNTRKRGLCWKKWGPRDWDLLRPQTARFPDVCIHVLRSCMPGVFVEGGGGGCALVVWCGLDQMVHAPDRPWTRSPSFPTPPSHTHTAPTAYAPLWAPSGPSSDPPSASRRGWNRGKRTLIGRAGALDTFTS